MKTLNINDVKFEIILHEEHIPVRGNAQASGDDSQDREAEDYIIDQLDKGNLWAWCEVELKAKYKSIEASDYLGRCSYASEQDFIKGGYYEDMKVEVFNQLKLKVEEIVKELCD